MTEFSKEAREIAKKANECCHRSDGYREEIEQIVLKTILEAHAQGKEEGIKEEAINCHKHCEKAREDALEEAAKMAESLMIYTGPGGEDPEKFQRIIANKIRSLSKKEKKG